MFTADDHSSQESNLCLGTVKSARTSFLLFDLVFMFMQKSMAAYMKDINSLFKQTISPDNQFFLFFLFFTRLTIRTSSYLVYEVSVNTIRQLLDEGIHN